MNKDFKIQLGLRIKELRQANRLTQEMLAEKLNMERSNLARIESGRQFPNAENLQKFAKIFNVTTDELFNFGHFKSKQELIKEINTNLNEFETNKIQYIHKMILNLRNI